MIGEANLSRIDRFWLTLQRDYLPDLFLWWPPRILTRNLDRFARWFNAHRPHQGINQIAPDDLADDRVPQLAENASAGRFTRTYYEGDPRLPVYRFTQAA